MTVVFAQIITDFEQFFCIGLLCSFLEQVERLRKTGQKARQANHEGAMKIYCYGDSHTRYFKHANMLKWTGVTFGAKPSVEARDYVAASAKGFSSPGTSLFTNRKFSRDFNEDQPHFICLAFGQVDAEVGFYYRRYVKGSRHTAEDDLEAVYNGYVDYALSILEGRQMAFKGPNPSVLKNKIQLKRYVYARLSVRMASQAERQRLLDVFKHDPPTVEAHAEINVKAADILRQICKERRFPYFDIRDTVEDQSLPGTARWDFIPTNSDVHLLDSLTVRKAHYERLVSALTSD